MKNSAATSSWIVVPRPNPWAEVRLFCFPYGGGGASIYRTWPQSLPDTVEVCAIQLPGRENRLREAPFTDIIGVVQELVEVLRPKLTLPFAVFGHSLGAFIGFELAHQLCRENVDGLIHLFVSGQRAPQFPNPSPPIRQLSGDQFISELRRRYDGIPQAVLQIPELMQIMLPVLRADLTMDESYVYLRDSKPLNCPITAFGGWQDPQVKQENLIAWRAETHRSFTLKMFPGDHFFLESARKPLLQAVAEGLKRSFNGNI